MDMSSWYTFAPRNTPEPGEIGMQDWLAEAGGPVRPDHSRQDKLYYNGKPIKLWGLNLCYGACSPEQALADKRAAFYPKYGINSVRLHKYVDGPGWAGIQSKDSCVDFDPAGLDRMDYQVAKFKEAGIYVLLSAHFGALKLGPADKQYVPYLEEFGKFGNDNRITHAAQRACTTRPSCRTCRSPDGQPAQAQEPVHGPDLCQGSGRRVRRDHQRAEHPLLHLDGPAQGQSHAPPAGGRERFCDWLEPSTAPRRSSVAAWGDKAFDGFANDGFPPVGENLDKNNILPLGNPWYWDPAQLNGSQAFRRQRLLDTLVSSTACRCEFYDRYVQAMREAGYEGEILGSNWQAGQALSHFYNLHSDWRVGTIDRHNYFGGGSTRPAHVQQRDHAAHRRLRHAQRRPAAGGRPPVHALGVDPRLPERVGRGRPGHPRRLRHGPARLGRLLHVPERRQRRLQRPDRPGHVGCRPPRRCWASSPPWPDRSCAAT